MEDVTSFYDRRSERYDEVFDTLYFRVYDAITWKYLEPYVPTSPGSLVLDAAGGTGRWAVRMAEKGCRVVLVDASEGMLAVAETKARAKGLQERILVRKGNIRATGFADNTFDMVLCEHALFLCRDPDVVLSELRRVLKKRAPLIVSAQNRYVQSLASLPNKPSADNIDKAFRVLIGEEHDGMTKDGTVKLYTWTPGEFRTLLERSGLRVEKIVGKAITMPLRISEGLYSKEKYPEYLFEKILRYELALCEKPDAAALAGHLQAIAFKV